MKNTLKTWLILAGILLASVLDAQNKTYVHDGYTGIRTVTFGDEYLYVFDVYRKSPAHRAGIRPWDAIISINDSAIRADEIYYNQVEELLYNRSGISYELIINIDRKDTLVPIKITSEFKPDQFIICNYEYLVDSSGELSIEDILTDSVQDLFAGPNMKRITVKKVIPGEFADTSGIRPGDILYSLYPMVDQSSFNFNLEYGGRGFILADEEMMITCIRDTSQFEVFKPEYVEELGITSQFYSDIRSRIIWKKFVFMNRISEDRSYLLSLGGMPESADLYFVQDSIVAEGQHLWSDKNQSDLVYKDKDLFRLDLKKDQNQVFYLRIEKEIYPERDDIILPLSLLTELDRKERLLIGSLFGIMFFIAVYYLILFLFLRKRSHLYFVLYITTFSIYILVYIGYVFEGGFPDRVFRYLDYPVSTTIAFTFYLLFGIKYLGLKKNLRFWCRLTYPVLAVFWISSIFDFSVKFFFPDFMDKWLYYVTIDTITDGILYFTIFYPIIPAIISIRKGVRTAWYFVIAGIILVVLVVFFFHTWDIVSFNSNRYPTLFSKILVESTLPVAATLQFIVFFIGMAHQMRIDDREKKLAQQKIIEQMKENERLKDKVNRELEEKVRERTKEIEEQKEEIETQRDEISSQRDLLISQKNEITDSINYARRIQEAVLPASTFLSEVMPEHFVLFRPRDIVSGDFYWIREIKNYVVVVAADCTGHGIPGAFMSMLGITLLNEQVSRSKFDKPGEILDRLRKKVKDTLSQKGEIAEQKDGMDMAMAIIDKVSFDLQYAGAFNPLYLIRKDSEEKDPGLDDYKSLEMDNLCLYEIKADRQPVGIYDMEKEFETKVIKLRDGDSIYLFSDGFSDQIGGVRGKKFLSRNFKRKLLSIQDLSMEEQKTVLDKTLEEWKSGFEQVDDILVIGIRSIFN